jgi:hypothetical protein
MQRSPQIFVLGEGNAKLGDAQQPRGVEKGVAERREAGIQPGLAAVLRECAQHLDACGVDAAHLAGIQHQRFGLGHQR